ncbi:hypothetical protein GF412_00105 [Candidatus Micrarchaeota archaeon]|nr:hypothetical protein [Candidatus Micrarchaeota archaeon]MBD3417378.1 hypothetical protein [Candidatus Micrarchaeota archaeon]
MSERQYKQFLSVLNKEGKKNEILVELPKGFTNYYQIHDGMVHKDEQGEYSNIYIKSTGTLPYPFEENAAAVVKVQNHEDGNITYTVTAYDDEVNQIAKAATVEEIDPNPYEMETKTALFDTPEGKTWLERIGTEGGEAEGEPIEQENEFSGNKERIGTILNVPPNQIFPLLKKALKPPIENKKGNIGNEKARQ